MAKQVRRHAKRLRSKSRTHQVVELAEGIYHVTSGKSAKTYTVTLGAHGQVGCTCDWAKYRRRGQPTACSHTISVFNWIAEQDGTAVSAWASESEARRQHKHIVRDLASDGVLLTERR